MRLLRSFFCFWALAIGLSAQTPPVPTQFVTDRAGFLQEDTRRDLSLKLEAVQQRTGHQIIVYIQPSAEGVPIEDFTVNAFKAWRVGSIGLNDGAALFIFPADRKMRIEVGYGLESQLPDITCGLIINELIAPKFRSGDPDAGVRDGVGAMLQAIGAEEGNTLPKDAPRRNRGQNPSPGTIIFFLLVGAFFLYIRIRMGGGWIMGGGGWGGGGWSSGGGGGWSSGGGGGFSGGGGFRGGGGASGGW